MIRHSDMPHMALRKAEAHHPPREPATRGKSHRPRVVHRRDPPPTGDAFPYDLLELHSVFGMYVVVPK